MFGRKKSLIYILMMGLLIVVTVLQIKSEYSQMLLEIETKNESISQNVNDIMTSAIQQLNLLGEEIEQTFEHEYYSFDGNVAYDGKDFKIEKNGENHPAVVGLYNDQLEFDEMLDEIEMITRFDSFFENVKNNLDEVQWIYYLSKNDFISIYPDPKFSASEFIPESHNYEFYQLTLNEVNPDRLVKFTTVYEDQLGAGTMITMTRPIYKEDVFMGSLSVDFTLKKLSNYLLTERTSFVKYGLINESYQVIASSIPLNLGDEIVRVEDFLKSDYNTFSENFKFNDSASINAGDYTIYTSPLSDAPIVLITEVNMTTLFILTIGKVLPITGALLGLIAILRLYYKTLKIRDSFEKNERKFKSIFEQSNNVAVILDVDGRVNYCNQTALTLSGISLKEVINQYFCELPWWNYSDEVQTLIKTGLEKVVNGDSFEEEVLIYDQKGVEHTFTINIFGVRDDIGQLESIVSTGIDITERKKMENKFESMSKTDLLTQAFNRRGMYDIINQFVSLNHRKQLPFIILICDIDLFKNVNDNYGHMVGDEILIGLVNLLKKSARPSDVVGRWGGEEFTILLQDTEISEGLMVAERIRKSVSTHPFKVDSGNSIVYINITIGLKQYDPKYDVNQNLKMADEALYYGKDNGRNQVNDYDTLFGDEKDKL